MISNNKNVNYAWSINWKVWLCRRTRNVIKLVKKSITCGLQYTSKDGDKLHVNRDNVISVIKAVRQRNEK